MRSVKTKIADVARQAGVSKSTISNYLNGRFESMSPKTRDKIEAAIQSLSYVPDITARRLSAKVRCNVICLVIGFSFAETFETVYYPTVMRQVGRAASERGYRTLVYTREGTRNREDMEYLKGLSRSMADGFMLFDLVEDDPYFRSFQEDGVPYVCVGKYDGTDDYHYVATDHAGAICQAVDHLAELGHSRIGIMLEEGFSVVSVTRRRAFAEAMEARGLTARPEYVPTVPVHSVCRNEESYRAFQRTMSMDIPPTAMIVPGNSIYQVERIAAKLGKRIPEDLSLVIVDYSSASYTYHQRNYTHLASRAGTVSEKAFNNLLAFIEHPEEGFVSEMVPTKLVVGDTTVSPAGYDAH